MRAERNKAGIAILAAMLAIATGIFFSSRVDQPDLAAASQGALRKPTGTLQLVASEPMPVTEAEMCPLVPASSPTLLVSALRQRAALNAAGAEAPDENRSSAEMIDREPARVIKDPYATYSTVAVDVQRNEMVLQDENLFQIMVYDRQANTPPAAAMTEPKRVIGGPKTKVEFNCGLYIDPKTGDIYSVNNDTVDTMVIFSRESKGDVPPTRELTTPHGTYGVAVDEGKQELYLTVEHDNAYVVYHKMAQGKEPPIRLVQGDHTGLADPHGIYVDTKHGWVFVTNHGSTHRVSASVGGGSSSEQEAGGGSRTPNNFPLNRVAAVPGSGQMLPPSINVYATDASGDAAPLRVIQGPKTHLNWPAQLSVDEEKGELYVANDGGDSILVFRATAEGNVEPLRTIKGPNTGIKNPTGVFVDTKNDEVVVANMGNHSATVFRRGVNGNVAPLRTVRSAPLDKPTLAIGNPGGLAYDSKRDEILVPN